MQALAAFTMRGRSQAALVAAASAALSLVIPLLGLISGGVVALVTLRLGLVEGLLVGAVASLTSGLLALAVFESPVADVALVVAQWLSVWVLGVVLRHSRSLDLTLQLVVIFGLLILAGLHLQSVNPADYWKEVLEPLRRNLVEGGVVDAARSEALVGELARWMTGAFAAGFCFQALLALMLGRWWQALLYNPGGFGAEFRALRVHPALAYLALALFALVLVQPHAMWAAELLLLVLPLFLLQGIAVMHAAAATFALHRAWLVGFYALLVIAMPQAEVVVAGVGLADVWADVRRRMRARTLTKR